MSRTLLYSLLLAASLINASKAAPFTPKYDAQIVETLRAQAANPAARELRAMRTELRKNPQNLELALHVARRYIEQSRAEADPRYLGYAQAALAPWWNLSSPPLPVLVLRATVLQSNHHFDAALADLAEVLRQQPDNAQAWLTRAVILQVRGEYAEARQSCERLRGIVGELVLAMCMSNIASLSGQAPRAYETLRVIFNHSDTASPAEKIWILSALGEMAARLGKVDAAEKHFQDALALGNPDSYLKGAYADFLLDRKRPAEVIDLLNDETRADALLLRLALAEQVTSSANLAQHSAALKARFKASRMRGDTVHRREEARFTLHLLREPEAALQLAQANWEVQREPADARIFLEAAAAANKPDAARPVLDWLARTRLEDANLAPLVQRLQSRGS
ncbi:MAG: tetratricopeptide repeat protein [Burkholderiales bacterium]|nr:tetratricopeptide repeat protein [Burkholderiales bacterium]